MFLLPLVLALSGCRISASAEDLYALPRLPEEYEALSAQLSEILASGAEYAQPQTGGNLPPVQMVDLDGDGVDEVLAFFRQSSEERPLKIYIFRAVEDQYVQTAHIDGSGTSIHSIRYADMDGDGVQELIVSWSVSAEIQALAVYVLEDLEPVQVVTTPYARYEAVDLDGDDDLELVVLRSGDGETGVCLADYYDWDADESALLLHSTARISVAVAGIQGMQVGTLQTGETAVFVTGRTAQEEIAMTVTDVLVLRQELENIVLSSDTGVSTQIFRSLNLQPTDVDGDGATEIPVPAALPAEGGEEPCWKLSWHSFTADGEEKNKVITYHNLTERWYLILPEAWDGHFTVRQSGTGSVRATTFYALRGQSVGEELLTVYTLTGTDREVQAVKSGRAILRRRSSADAVYAVSFAEGYEQWPWAVEREVLAERFNVIVNRWSMGEN